MITHASRYLFVILPLLSVAATLPPDSELATRQERALRMVARDFNPRRAYDASSDE